MENAIIFNSSGECVDYVRNIQPQEDILSSEDRKHLFKARQYFISNLEKFKDHQISLQLATDLVARGIDIENLEYVINFEVARDKENYTHRAGRTGRMGKEGVVIAFVNHPEDIKILKKFL